MEHFKITSLFLISNFRHVLIVVFFFLADSLASKLYVLTLWNTVCSIFKDGARTTYEDGTDRVFRYIGTKFRRQEITQKKDYNKSVIFLFRM